MNAWFILTVLAILAVLVASYPLEARRIRRDAERLQGRLDSRPPMPADEFVERCDVPISDELAERVRRVLARVGEKSAEPGEVRIDPARIDPDDHVSDVGFNLDSLAHMEMLVELEKEFGLRFRFCEFRNAERVREIVQVVANRLAEKPKPGLDPDFGPMP